MAKHQDLDFQRGSRSEQSNQPVPDRFAKRDDWAVGGQEIAAPILALRWEFGQQIGRRVDKHLQEAINMNDVSREYPRTVSRNAARTELRLLSADDTADLKTFIASLPEHDLLFLSRDITHPKVIEAWIAAIPEGRVKSLVARENGVIVGLTAIVLHELSWSRHVGELRVLVSPSWRGKGLGRVLIQEYFAQALELGLAKLCVDDRRSARCDRRLRRHRLPSRGPVPQPR